MGKKFINNKLDEIIEEGKAQISNFLKRKKSRLEKEVIDKSEKKSKEIQKEQKFINDGKGEISKGICQ